MKYDELCEGYLTLKTRMFYPRNLELSKEFVEAFRKEYDRLVEIGENKKSLHSRLAKALRFHM
jgi:hypothetical protein